jgi:hypothetical protein
LAGAVPQMMTTRLPVLVGLMAVPVQAMTKKPFPEVYRWPRCRSRERCHGKGAEDDRGLTSGEQQPLFAPQPLPRATLRGRTFNVTSVAFRPEGKALASSGQGKTLKLWDVARGQEQATLRGHADTIASAALSPAHTWLLFVVCLWPSPPWTRPAPTGSLS